MNKEEVIKKASQTKALVGEMENAKTNKGNWVALIVAGVVAVALMIVEGALGHYNGIFAIGAICYIWASVFYFCQYFMAKRPWPVLFGAVLHGLAACVMIALYIVCHVQGW